MKGQNRNHEGAYFNINQNSVLKIFFKMFFNVIKYIIRIRRLQKLKIKFCSCILLIYNFLIFFMTLHESCVGVKNNLSKTID